MKSNQQDTPTYPVHKSEEVDTSIAASLFEIASSIEFRKLAAYYETKSIFDITGITRNENRHTNYLSWLFSEDGSHGIGTYAGKKLLKAIVSVRTGVQKENSKCHWEFNKEFEQSVKNCNFEVTALSSQREIKAGQGKESIDLQIDCKVSYDGAEEDVVIYIENKVLSKESDNQTEGYFKFLNADKSKKRIFVFLSPISAIEFEKEREPRCGSKEFIGLNYQILLDEVLEPCIARCDDSRVHSIMTDYVRALSKPSLLFASNDNKGEMIMAISSMERNLLNDFWSTNEEIMKALIYARSQDLTVAEEEREALVKAIDSGERGKNTKVSYTLYGERKNDVPGAEFLVDVVDKVLSNYPQHIDDIVSGNDFKFLQQGERPEKKSIWRNVKSITKWNIFIATSTDNGVKVGQAEKLVEYICKNIDQSKERSDILSDIELK